MATETSTPTSYVPAEPRRMSLPDDAPALYKAQYGLEVAVRRSGIDPVLYELIKIRASQINGCAFCIDMHTLDARAAGETEARINLLPAWREAPYYTARERAALALTESVTLVADTHVPDDVWADAAEVFSSEELAQVVMAIVVINGWNRMQIATRSPAGEYTPADRHA
ncbi:MAG TPA: carboxymuconolactone decarboxylase family protein [Acidimicrobiales bacterium]|jgi:AhpD family alkylhydroperoxidase|nr:carboxymuconolactone decarboxylase family protein [Acidimicrobiales bacterium]